MEMELEGGTVGAEFALSPTDDRLGKRSGVAH